MESKTNILIVDDDVSQCKTMSFVLTHKGHAVAYAHDGPEAIKKVRKGPFDIIFMDIKMPIMNGVDAYKRIKKIRPEAVVIMMTAYSVDDLVQEALQEGAHSVLYKPLDMEKVVGFAERASRAMQSRPSRKKSITNTPSPQYSN